MVPRWHLELIKTPTPILEILPERERERAREKKKLQCELPININGWHGHVRHALYPQFLDTGPILVACVGFCVLYSSIVFSCIVLYYTVLYCIMLIYMHDGIGKRSRHDLKHVEHVNVQLHDLTENVTLF